MSMTNDFDDNLDASTGQLLTPTDEAPAQMPLGVSGGGFGGDGEEGTFGEVPMTDLSKPAGSGKGQSMLVLLLVLIVAGGTLWAMRVTGKVDKGDHSVSAAEKKVDAALARLNGKGAAGSPLNDQNLDSLFGDTDQIVAVFENDPTKKQVGVENLQKNPFDMYIAQKKASKNEPVIDRVKAERLAALKTEFASLKLQSVLNGATPLAVISGKVVKTNDTVGSFTVTRITATGVELSAEGNVYTLTMTEPGAAGGSGTKKLR